MWVYRHMLKIPWTKNISNEAVLGMMGRGRELVSVIKRQRKMEYLGHMIRGPKYEFLRLITMGKIEGKKWIGRKKLSWLRNMRMRSQTSGCGQCINKKKKRVYVLDRLLEVVV
ncbi:uncharacterized protein LOC143915545 [Arctopsyche grandis]|uniref:uncharacterized protein LOC143915545 n=1 Tax=Arctopsyche grandis TaxID=121162 RepID=UPI00406D9107